MKEENHTITVESYITKITRKTDKNSNEYLIVNGLGIPAFVFEKKISKDRGNGLENHQDRTFIFTVENGKDNSYIVLDFEIKT